MRPGFFPLAVAATGALGVNALLIKLMVWPTGQVALPVLALALLGLALGLWWRGD